MSAVELIIPVEADLLILARLTAAAVAARADFGIEEIDDFRLAVDELCLSVIDSAEGENVHLRFVHEDDAITVACCIDGRKIESLRDGPTDELSQRIIEALVDESGFATEGDLMGRWIRKRRVQVTH